MSPLTSFLAVAACWIATLPYSAATVAPTPPSSPSQHSHYERPSAKGGPYKDRVIVFVHGIFGDADDTWRYSPSVYWPRLLLRDDAFRDWDVYVAGYSTPYVGNKMNLDDLVTNLNNRLASDEVFSRHREVVFVCHSLGGLLVQRLLLTHQKYATQVRFIYFFSTPETGAQIAKIATLFNADPLLQVLLPGDENEYLQNLENEWKGAEFHVRRLCAYETEAYKGVLVADRLSSTRNCDESVAIPANHVTIVKPSGKDHDSYIALRNAVLANPISKLPKPPAESPKVNTRNFAKLQFAFWPIDPKNDKLNDEVSVPIVGGIVTVAFTAKNVGTAQADNGQVWIQICDGCKFAEEPEGTTMPPGDQIVRRKHFDSLHMGSYFEATTLKVIPPSGAPYFTIALKYACERCPPINNKHPQKLKSA